MEKKHTNIKKTKRNLEILSLHEKNGLGYRRLGKLYNLHFTRVKEIILNAREQAK